MQQQQICILYEVQLYSYAWYRSYNNIPVQTMQCYSNNNYPNTVLLKIYRSFLAQNFVPANSIKFTSLSKIIIGCYPQPLLQVIYTQPQNKHPSSVQLAEKNIALAVDYIIIISPGSLIMKCPYNYSGEETLRLLQHVGSCSSVVRVLKLEVLDLIPSSYPGFVG